MKTWKVRGTVIEPICIADRHGAAGQYTTLDYIPGGSWWGALAALTGVTPDIAPPPAFIDVFYADDVIFGALLPSLGGQRAYPIPESARTLKARPGFDGGVGVLLTNGQGGEVEVQPSGVDDLLRGARRGGPDWQPLGGWAVTLGSRETTERVSPKREYHGHGVSAPERSPESRQLFGREDLVRGQEFLGGLTALTDHAASALTQLIAGYTENVVVDLAIGRQPGFVRVKLIDQGDADFDWAPALDANIDCNDITITFRTDALIVDEWLRPVRTLTEHVVAGALGAGVTVTEDGHFSSVRVVNGWSGAHRRPRETEHAVAAGSAFRFRLTWDAGVSQTERVRRLTELQRRGLGLRRNEGFGELKVNDEFHVRYGG